MRIRDWRDILEDVTDRSGDPDDWRAIAGQRDDGVGEEMFLGHPRVGVYHLKTYPKNPYEVKGVGTQVARRLDDEIGSFFPDRDSNGRFAVRDAPEDEDDAKTRAKRLVEALKVHSEAPTTPDDLFTDVMEAIDSPAFGPMEFDLADRPEGLDELSSSFEEAERLLSTELDDLIEEDEVDRGFH